MRSDRPRVPADLLELAPDGRSIAVSFDGDPNLGIFDVRSGALIRSFGGDITAAKFLKSGMLVAGTRSGALLKLEPKSGSAMPLEAAHGDKIYSIAVSRDDRIGVSAALGQSIELWDAESGRSLGTLARSPLI